MKKAFLAVVVVLLVFSLVACSTAVSGATDSKTSDESAPADVETVEAGNYTVGVLYCMLSAPAVKVVSVFVESKAEELGISLVELDGEFDAQKQTDQLNSLISQGVDAIILNPVDSKSIIPAVKKATEAGIPVFMMGMDIDASGKEYVVTYIGEDEKKVGEAAGELMKEAMGDAEGRILIVEGKAGTDPQINRTAGFEEAIAGSNISVVAKVAGDFDKALAMNVTQDALTKYPDINGIWVHDDTMCVGVVQAMKTMGYTGDDITVISYNGNQNGYDFVVNGDIYATMIQSMKWIGEKTMEITNEYLQGATVEPIYVEETIEKITRDNADAYDQSLLW